MLSFKLFVEHKLYDKDAERENAKKSNLTPHTVNGWHVHAVPHAMSQAVRLHPEKAEGDWHKLHHVVTDKLTKTTKPHTGETVFFSKSLGHGYVADVDHHRKVVRVITTLPHGHERSTHPGDKHYVVEGVEYDVIWVD